MSDLRLQRNKYKPFYVLFFILLGLTFLTVAVCWPARLEINSIRQNQPLDRLAKTAFQQEPTTSPFWEGPSEVRTRELSGTTSISQGIPQAIRAAHGDEQTTELIVQVLSEESGEPLVEIWVLCESRPAEASRPSSATTIAVQTDRRGIAQFRVPPGVAFAYTHCQPERGIFVAIPLANIVHATLSTRTFADANIFLRVLEAGTGHPIEGAEVNTEPFADGCVKGYTAKALTDNYGIATICAPSWLDGNFRVYARGYELAAVSLKAAQDCDALAAGQIFDVFLVPGACMEGIVTDHLGVPVKNVVVNLEAQIVNMSPPTFAKVDDSQEPKAWSSTTNEQGLYVIDNLPAGMALSLDVRYRGELVIDEPHALTLDIGEVLLRNFCLGGTGTVQGVVFDLMGAPAAGQPLWLVRGSSSRIIHRLDNPLAETLTDSRGRFVFKGVPHGCWLVGPAPREQFAPRAPLPMARMVDLPSSLSVVEVELRLQEGHFVSGHCIGLRGEGIPDIQISILAASINTTSGTDGKFIIGPLSAGRHELEVADGVYCLDAEGGRLVVEAGETNVQVRLGRTASIRGIVLAEKDGASLEAEVVVQMGAKLRYGYTKPDGSFSIMSLPRRCVLVARTSTGLVSAPYAMDLRAGEEREINLLVSEGGRAHLTLPGGDVWARIVVDGYVVDLVSEREAITCPFRPGVFAVELMEDQTVMAALEAYVGAGEIANISLP